MKWITNIYSKGTYPADRLSNFCPHPFMFDGVPVTSMEALLQSFKFPDPEQQRQICQLPSREAKEMGSAQNWKGYLYWMSRAYPRKSVQYRRLIARAYREMAAQNPDFCQALADSSPILVHTIGRSRRSKTCLTRWEFCLLLTRLRKHLRRQ